MGADLNTVDVFVLSEFKEGFQKTIRNLFAMFVI